MISPRKLSKLRDKWLLRRKIAGRWLRLIFSAKEVRLHHFATDAQLYAEGGWIFLQWHVEHAWALEVSGVGKVHPSAKVRIRATSGLTQIRLTAHGRGGPIHASARITVRPRLDYRAQGSPTAQHAWPPHAHFAVPPALQPLMQPNRALLWKQAGSQLHFRAKGTSPLLGYRHSPPAELIAFAHQATTLQPLSRQLDQIRQAQTLDELNSLKATLVLCAIPLSTFLYLLP